MIVNGTILTTGNPITIDQLLTDLAIERRGIAVAVNGEILRRGVWATHPLCDDDHVEIVTAAAGG